jgi:hypothetical protein
LRLKFKAQRAQLGFENLILHCGTTKKNLRTCALHHNMPNSAKYIPATDVTNANPYFPYHSEKTSPENFPLDFQD